MKEQNPLLGAVILQHPKDDLKTVTMSLYNPPECAAQTSRKKHVF